MDRKKKALDIYPEDYSYLCGRSLKLVRHMTQTAVKESQGSEQSICYIVISHGLIIDALGYIFNKFQKDKLVDFLDVSEKQ